MQFPYQSGLPVESVDHHRKLPLVQSTVESSAMIVNAGYAKATGVIEPSPSDTSLRGLDGVNLFLAGVLSGFGPYVAVFLAEQNWTQRDIGFVLTAAGFAGLLSQIPGGELLDVIRSKRFAVALGALASNAMHWCPAFIKSWYPTGNELTDLAGAVAACLRFMFISSVLDHSIGTSDSSKARDGCLTV